MGKPKKTKFRPTKHAVDQFRQRFYPSISDAVAAERLREIARGAKPLTYKEAVPA